MKHGVNQISDQSLKGFSFEKYMISEINRIFDVPVQKIPEIKTNETFDFKIKVNSSMRNIVNILNIHFENDCYINLSKSMSQKDSIAKDYLLLVEAKQSFNLVKKYFFKQSNNTIDNQIVHIIIYNITDVNEQEKEQLTKENEKLFKKYSNGSFILLFFNNSKKLYDTFTNVDKLMSDLTQIKIDNKIFKSKIENLENKVNNLTKEQNLNNSINNKEDKLELLKVAKENLRQFIQIYAKKYDDLFIKLKMNTDFERKVSKLKKRKILKEDVEKLNIDNEIHWKEIEKLNKDNEILRKEVKKLNKDNEIHWKEIEKLYKEILKLKKKNENLWKEVQKLKEDNKTLERKVNNLEKSVKRNNTNNRILKLKVDKLEKIICEKFNISENDLFGNLPNLSIDEMNQPYSEVNSLDEQHHFKPKENPLLGKKHKK